MRFVELSNQNVSLSCLSIYCPIKINFGSCQISHLVMTSSRSSFSLSSYFCQDFFLKGKPKLQIAFFLCIFRLSLVPIKINLIVMVKVVKLTDSVLSQQRSEFSPKTRPLRIACSINLILTKPNMLRKWSCFIGMWALI